MATKTNSKPSYESIKQAVLDYAEFKTDVCPVGFKTMANAFRHWQNDWYNGSGVYSSPAEASDAYEDWYMDKLILMKKIQN